MEQEIVIFRDFLKKRGMRHTRERESILREILSSSDHFDVDELFIRMKKKSSVSKASIYRTIPLLIESGLIGEVYLENGHMHYELVFGREHHCHLRCSRCNTIIEFTDNRLIQIAHEVSKHHDFKDEWHKMEIRGLCPSCSRKNQQA